MSQSKPREFWLKNYTDTGWTVVDETAHPTGLIRVIEYSAHAQLMEMAEAMAKALKSWQTLDDDAVDESVYDRISAIAESQRDKALRKFEAFKKAGGK